jgi:hypothetical protein
MDMRCRQKRTTSRKGFRRFGTRFWVFMSALIGLADSAGGLLYGLAIKGDKRHQVALDSETVEKALFEHLFYSQILIFSVPELLRGKPIFVYCYSSFHP